MVGCAFNDCTTNPANKSGKYKGITLFKITSRKGEFYENWKKGVLSILTRYRVVDQNLKEIIQKGNVFIFFMHFFSQVRNIPERIILISTTGLR